MLVVDSFERLNLLDGWLRNELLPALPHDHDDRAGRSPAAERGLAVTRPGGGR